MKLNRGDIVIANLESVSKGSIQKYTRPYIIISNNKANQYSPGCHSSSHVHKNMEKEISANPLSNTGCKVKVTDTDFEVFDSMALCEQIVSIDVNVHIERVVASISDTELLDKITECVKSRLGHMKSTIKYYRGICSGLHSHLYSMGGIFTERGIDFMTAEEYRALLDVDFNNVKIEDLTDIRKIKIDKNQPQSKRQAQFLNRWEIHICCVVEV